MADESLVIEIRDGGTTGPVPASTFAPAATSFNPAAVDPMGALDRAYADVQTRRADAVRDAEEESRRRTRASPRQDEPFDPVARARELLAAEERRAQVQAEMERLKPPPAFDPVAEAQRLYEVEQRRMAVQEQLERLRIPEVTAAFSASAEAQKLFDIENRRLEINKELDRLHRERNAAMPPGEATAAFDPVAEAQKLIETERRRKQIQAAYENATEGPGTATAANPQQSNAFEEILKRFGGTIANAIQQIAPGSGATAGGIGTAGAVGAAVAIAEVVDKSMAGIFDGLRHTVHELDQDFISLLENRPGEVINRTVDSVASALNKIPIAGQAYAAAFQLAAAPITEFIEVANAINRRGRELVDFSGPLALATTKADVRSLLADIREADRLGPEMARLIDAQSRAETEFRELIAPIKEVVITLVANAMENLIPFMEGVVITNAALYEAAIHFPDLLKVIFDFMTFQPGQAMADIVTMQTQIAEETAKILAHLKKAQDTVDNTGNKLLEETLRKARQGADRVGGVRNIDVLPGRRNIRPVFGGP